MAYYDAYRNAPGWGTSNYQFITPMQPTYQPQPNWSGRDYYRAHGALADPDIYDYAWNRVRNHSSIGLSFEEARIWHRRAYGGLGDILSMRPIEIGAAAAYEAWRNWKYHHGIYAQPLSGDTERQREALIGLAVSEATRLWQYTGRVTDAYGRLEACESAGATADRIFEYALMDSTAYDPYSGRGRLSRRGSASSLRSYSPFRSRSYSGPPSPYMGDGYGYGHGLSAYGGAYPSYGTPVTTYATPGYAAGYAGSYPGSYVQPAYAATSPVTVIQPSGHHRSHSHHSHRSGSRHRSSSRHRHRHSGSYSGAPYYVSSSYGY
ncbi:hypothetical protein ACEPAG_8109 [Sanghuangporus baumii]